MRVKSKIRVPPGGWRYTQPETGYAMSSFAFDDLLQQVIRHRQANGFDLSENWQAVWEAELCASMGIESSHCGEIAPLKPKGPGITIGHLLTFLKVVRAWMTRGFQFVEPEVAEARAEVCAGCPKNVDVKGCAGCTGVHTLLKILRGDRTTSHDANLRNCEVCGCVLALKVHLPDEANIQSTPPNTHWPEWCWAKPQ